MITEINSAGANSALFGVVGDWFDIHWCVVSDISGNGEFELKIYKGAAGSEIEIAHITFVRNAVQSQEGAIPVQMERVLKGTRISAAIQSDQAAVRTLGIKFMGHAYE
jgi:hypothetical protein